MFNYKQDLSKYQHIIKRYLKKIKKLNIKDKDINKLNLYILNNLNLFNVKSCKFDKKIYEYITRYVEEISYKIKEENIIKFIHEYSLKEKYHFSYEEINSFISILYFILLKKLSNMISVEHPQIIKYTVRKEIIVHNIVNSIDELFVCNIDKIISKSSDSDFELLKFDEYKNLDYVTRKKYREIISKEAKKNKISEFQFTKELSTKSKASGKYLCDYLFKRINYGAVSRVNFFISILITIIFLLFIYKFITKDFLTCFIFTIINYLFVFRLLSKIFPKEFVPKQQLGNISDKDKVMVVKYIVLNNPKDVINEYKKLEKYFLGNNLNNVNYTLLVDCTDCDHQIEPYDEEILEQGFKECSTLNKKYSKQLFYFVYRKRVKVGNIWCGYNRKNGAIEQFSKLLLDRYVLDEDYNYFTGYSTFSQKYKYVLVLDDLNYNFDIKEMIGILKHPYNNPISKKNKFVYGYSMIGLDGKNVYGQSLFSTNVLYDLEIYDKLLLQKMPNNIIFSNYLRTLSITNTAINVYDYESILKNNFHLLKWTMNKKSHFNTICKIETVNNILQIVCNLLSLILLIYLIINKSSSLWILYFLIVVPNFTSLPTFVYTDIKVVIKLIFNKKYKNSTIQNNYSNNRYYINYLFSLVLIILTIIFKLNIIFTLILSFLFIFNKVFNIIVDNLKRRLFL